MSLSAQINMQEGANGIRACAICPGEVATPILDRRPVKLTPDELEKVIQPEDIAEAVLFVARMHPRTSVHRSEEHTSELQSLMRISYAVFCLKKKKHLT